MKKPHGCCGVVLLGSLYNTNVLQTSEIGKYFFLLPIANMMATDIKLKRLSSGGFTI